MSSVPILIAKDKPPVWVELSEEGQGAFGLVAKPGVSPPPPPETMEEALGRIQPLVAVLFEKLRNVTNEPKEIELTLGLKLSGKVGIFVAESSGEASISVKLKWAP